MRKFAIPAFVLIMALVIGAGQLSRRHSKPASVRPSATATAAVKTTPKRKIYPYSVVPGGVDGIGDVIDRVQRDPVVANHYAPIRLSQLRRTVLERPKFAYVSYRLQNRIYWTALPVLLPAGEAVLSDGAQQIRGRCGNRISDTPQVPVAPPRERPRAEELDVPIESPEVPVVELLKPPPPPIIPVPSTPTVTPPTVTETTPTKETKTVTNGGTPPVTIPCCGIPVSLIPPETVTPFTPPEIPPVIVTGGSIPEVVLPPPTGPIPPGTTPTSPPSFPETPPPPGIPPTGPPGTPPPSVPPPSTPPPTTPPVDHPPVGPPPEQPPTGPPEYPPEVPPTTPEVPEPGTWVMLATGLAVLAVTGRAKVKRV